MNLRNPVARKLSANNLRHGLNDEISNQCNFINTLKLHLVFEDNLFEQIYSYLARPTLNELKKNDNDEIVGA